MQSYLKFALLAGAIGMTAVARAEVTVPVHQATPQGPGAEVGTVSLADSKYGLVLTPDLKGLPPGVHGFHVHENGSCDAKEQAGKPVPAGAAGGHYDPDGTNKHGTPWSDDGHRGDLPALYVSADGAATTPVLAPRLKLADVQGRALMVHAGGDNHSDHPQPLGGGGGRIACGVIPK
ncbi:superoxide dismutase family protein [Bordetella petrii]|uniref:superoxide dismutase family protein n=1 Tax=Bordetella petrii TaxID=94624 RepID=UPI00047A2343|nr:superoxide dismutase family protein [Bordetella petrii]